MVTRLAQLNLKASTRHLKAFNKNKQEQTGTNRVKKMRYEENGAKIIIHENVYLTFSVNTLVGQMTTKRVLLNLRLSLQF